MKNQRNNGQNIASEQNSTNGLFTSEEAYKQYMSDLISDGIFPDEEVAGISSYQETSGKFKNRLIETGNSIKELIFPSLNYDFA